MNNDVYSMGFNDGYNKAKQELLASLQEKIEGVIDDLGADKDDEDYIINQTRTKLLEKIQKISHEMGDGKTMNSNLTSEDLA